MDSIERLQADIDTAAGRLHAQHSEALQCARGCADCCIDGVTVFEVEAERIRAEHGELLANGQPHAAGACAFLDEERACRIYDARPYVCRTQGLPLRWLDELEGEVVEYRDVCPLNEAVGVESLPPEACWSLGPVEQRLQALQRDAHGSLRRVPLRSLFAQG